MIQYISLTVSESSVYLSGGFDRQCEAENDYFLFLSDMQPDHRDCSHKSIWKMTVVQESFGEWENVGSLLQPLQSHASIFYNETLFSFTKMKGIQHMQYVPYTVDFIISIQYQIERKPEKIMTLAKHLDPIKSPNNTMKSQV